MVDAPRGDAPPARSCLICALNVATTAPSSHTLSGVHRRELDCGGSNYPSRQVCTCSCAPVTECGPIKRSESQKSGRAFVATLRRAIAEVRGTLVSACEAYVPEVRGLRGR